MAADAVRDLEERAGEPAGRAHMDGCEPAGQPLQPRAARQQVALGDAACWRSCLCICVQGVG